MSSTAARPSWLEWSSTTACTCGVMRCKQAFSFPHSTTGTFLISMSEESYTFHSQLWTTQYKKSEKCLKTTFQAAVINYQSSTILQSVLHEFRKFWFRRHWFCRFSMLTRKNSEPISMPHVSDSRFVFHIPLWYYRKGLERTWGGGPKVDHICVMLSMSVSKSGWTRHRTKLVREFGSEEPEDVKSREDVVHNTLQFMSLHLMEGLRAGLSFL